MSVCAGLVFEESVYSRVRGQGAKCVLRWPETREPGRGGTCRHGGIEGPEGKSKYRYYMCVCYGVACVCVCACACACKGCLRRCERCEGVERLPEAIKMQERATEAKVLEAYIFVM